MHHFLDHMNQKVVHVKFKQPRLPIVSRKTIELVSGVDIQILLAIVDDALENDVVTDSKKRYFRR